VSASHPVWVAGRAVEMTVAEMMGEALVVPNVAALVSPDAAGDRVLLQHRDKPGESVRGLLEVPTGRWRAGETPAQALRREVAEETGLTVQTVTGAERTVEPHVGQPVVVAEPAVVVVGTGGAYPALLVAFACIADGEPRGLPGESADPAFYRLETVREMLAQPTGFTATTFALLSAWLER
jgi:8-oxo-dGTP pyrophosphatase MutT (NUDIX family)